MADSGMTGGGGRGPEVEARGAGAPDPVTAHARALVGCASRQEAVAYAARLRGRELAAVAERLGVHVRGPVARVRAAVVASAIGAVLNSAAIRFHGRPAAEADAFLADYRQRRLAGLEARREPSGGAEVRDSTAGGPGVDTDRCGACGEPIRWGGTVHPGWLHADPEHIHAGGYFHAAEPAPARGELVETSAVAGKDPDVERARRVCPALGLEPAPTDRLRGWASPVVAEAVWALRASGVRHAVDAERHLAAVRDELSETELASVLAEFDRVVECSSASFPCDPVQLAVRRGPGDFRGVYLRVEDDRQHQMAEIRLSPKQVDDLCQALCDASPREELPALPEVRALTRPTVREAAEADQVRAPGDDVERPARGVLVEQATALRDQLTGALQRLKAAGGRPAAEGGQAEEPRRYERTAGMAPAAAAGW